MGLSSGLHCHVRSFAVLVDDLVEFVTNVKGLRRVKGVVCRVVKNKYNISQQGLSPCLCLYNAGVFACPLHEIHCGLYIVS